MPRLLLVLPYANLNGTERHVQLLARIAAAQGWEAMVALPPGPMQALLRDEGIPVLELPVLTLGSFATAVGLLRREMQRFDLAHVHAAMELALALGWKRRRRVVFTAHCYHTDLDYMKAGLFLNPSCEATVSVSGAERARLLRGGLDPARHRTVLNGIDLAPFHAAEAAPLRAELKLGDADLLVGTVGRLSPMKRVEDLIRAISMARGRIQLAIAGDGPERPRLERLAARLGVKDRVHWLGRREDVPAVLAALDVFATASEREGLSLAGLEAMACGLPLVVTDLPEFAEIGDPRWALQVPVRAPSALAEALDTLQADPARRRAMGQEAREGSLAFSAERMGLEILEIYREVLSRPRPRPSRSAGSPRGTPRA